MIYKVSKYIFLVICTGKGKPAGFMRVSVTGTGTGPEISTPEKPVPVGSGHGLLPHRIQTPNKISTTRPFSSFLALIITQQLKVSFVSSIY